MEEKEILQSIAIYLQKKYNGLCEMENITHQLQDTLHYNDVVTIRMLVRMRQQEIDNIDGFDRQRQEFDARLSEAQRNALPKGDATCFGAESAPFVQRIHEIIDKNHRLLGRLIEEDKKVNRKLAGKDTYYKD